METEKESGVSVPVQEDVLITAHFVFFFGTVTLSFTFGGSEMSTKALTMDSDRSNIELDRCSWVFKVTHDIKIIQRGQITLGDNRTAKLLRYPNPWSAVIYSCIHCVLCTFSVSVSHPAAPCSGTLRQSRFGCGRLPPLSFSWLTLLGRKGRVALPPEGCLWLWCCAFLWLATWFVFLMPPFWWATAERWKEDEDQSRCAFWQSTVWIWEKPDNIQRDGRCERCTWGSRCRPRRDVLVSSGTTGATLSEALPGWACGRDFETFRWT